MAFQDYNSVKVLIVDDQADVLMIMRNMLQELGVNQIFEASNGGEADIFIETAMDMINLIICDWNMPEKDGFEVLKKVKKINPGVPFLMITGRGDIGSVMNAKNAGVNGYIRKPFSLVQLDKKISHMMEEAATIKA